MTQKVNQQGFTLLELVVVIAIISILAGFALDRYARLLVDVERGTMEYNLGALRSSLSMQVADYYVSGKMNELPELLEKNPMFLLAEKPKNYLGEYAERESHRLETGSWFYDPEEKSLVYLVRHEEFFESKLKDPKRVHFRVVAVYTEQADKKYLSGLALEAKEPYRWLKSENR